MIIGGILKIGGMLMIIGGILIIIGGNLRIGGTFSPCHQGNGVPPI